jgi:hypothetical protein
VSYLRHTKNLASGYRFYFCSICKFLNIIHGVGIILILISNNGGKTLMMNNIRKYRQKYFLKCFRKCFSLYHRNSSWSKIHLEQCTVYTVHCTHRNQTISRKGANIISRRPSHGYLARRCCPQAFLRIFSEITYIRTVGNSSLLKIYTLPNHTITIGVCILETHLLGLLYGGGASFVQKWSMPWISPNI